jgi:hypothetical protein
LSHETRAHLAELLAELDAVSKPRPTVAGSDAMVAHAPAVGNSIRARVDAELRGRVGDLITRIRTDTEVEADEYARVSTSEVPLDELWSLVGRQTTSRTTRELIASDRADLTIEQAVIDWSADLPFPSELPSAAQARLKYWAR